MGLEVFQPLGMGLRHRQIGLQAEQQGDVDVDALADQGGDGRNARLGAGHLDHQVPAVHRLPQALGLVDGPVGVQGEVGRHLQAHIAVAAAGAVPDRLQLVGGGLDVLDRHLLVEVHGAEVALGHRRLDAVVVVVPLPDRLLEDRRIGGHAGDGVLLDQALQLAALHELAMHVVEPDGLARLTELLQRIGHGLS